MQAVGKVTEPELNPMGFQKPYQRSFTIDADMAIRCLVIGRGERPADSLREITGHADNQQSSWFEYPDDFPDGGGIVGYMLQNLRADDQIEDSICKRQPGDIRNR